MVRVYSANVEDNVKDKLISLQKDSGKTQPVFIEEMVSLYEKSLQSGNKSVELEMLEDFTKQIFQIHFNMHKNISFKEDILKKDFLLKETEYRDKILEYEKTLEIQNSSYANSIKELQDSILHKDDEISNLKAKINEKNTLIEKQNKEIKTYETILEFKSELERQIRLLDDELKNKDEKINSYANKLKEVESENAKSLTELNNSIAALKDNLKNELETRYKLQSELAIVNEKIKYSELIVNDKNLLIEELKTRSKQEKLVELEENNVTKISS